MQLTLCSSAALRQLRALRCSSSRDCTLRRCDLRNPDPSPRTRWTWGLLRDLSVLAPLDSGEIRSVAVSKQECRLRMRGVSNRAFSCDVPAGAFVDLGEGIAISSPELLFVELSQELPLPNRLMLGLELCGGFSLAPDGAEGGATAMGVAPVTSVARLSAFVDACEGLRGRKRARRALRLIADNAWSPMEALVAAMLALPLEEGGYGLGRCLLNERHETPEPLKATTACASRVPDIMIPDTGVGFNYDGYGHLDLASIVEATERLCADPGSGAADRQLRTRVQAVREKAVDDMRRNRELAAQGLTVFPVVKEDVYSEGGLDAVVAQAVAALEAHTGKRLVAQREALASHFAMKKRQELIWSLAPGEDRTLPDYGFDDEFIRL